FAPRFLPARQRLSAGFHAHRDRVLIRQNDGALAEHELLFEDLEKRVAPDPERLLDGQTAARHERAVARQAHSRGVVHRDVSVSGARPMTRSHVMSFDWLRMPTRRMDRSSGPRIGSIFVFSLRVSIATSGSSVPARIASTTSTGPSTQIVGSAEGSIS